MAEQAEEKYPTMSQILKELKHIHEIGFPITVVNLAFYLKNMVSVLCMGRLGRLELAGGALAIGFTNITGYSVLSGLALGMEPLCSQAFGSRNLSLVTVTVKRTILMLLFASLPIALLWLNLQPIMLKLNQDRSVTRVASLYCLFAMPDLLANTLLHPLRIYLRTNGHVNPLMWCTTLASLLHIPLTCYLTFALHLGVPGIAIATFSTNFITFFLLLFYLLYTREPYSLFTPISTSPSWGVLLKLSLPSCIGVCLEWWWYELMTLLAGYLTNPRVTLAASAIVIQTTSLMYTLPTALSASVSARVGTELGAGRPRRARAATMVTMSLAFVVSLLGLGLTIMGRKVWGRVFSEDDEVLKLTMAVLPVIGLCELANCPQTTGCGVLRGSARPAIGATINLCSFYLVGTPIAIVLAFVLRLGFMGLCYGLLAAQIACALSVVTVVWKTDWVREAMRARELVGSGACEETGFLKEESV